jgi:murein DD-endopeptidase MepM/ murein hydrolase activator NlpD
MADLSRIEAPIERRRRVTENRDAVLPARRNTQAPDLEINAPIRRPNADAAEVLKRTLGLVEDAAMSYIGSEQERQMERRSAQGAADATVGKPDEKRLKNSLAYKKAYYTETARNAAFKIDAEVTRAVEERLRDEENPADLDDIAQIIDGAFRAGALDEDGKPRFVDPEAQALAARQLAMTRERIMDASFKTIKAREDERLIATAADNIVTEIIQTRGVRDLSTLEKPQTAAPSTPSAPLTGLPVPGTITSAFGTRAAPTAGASTNHGGVDIGAPEGSPVAIRAAGTVVAAGSGGTRGNWIEVDHGGGVTTRYFHLASANVKKGDVLGPGAVVGLVGRTGNATGPHLHYSVLKDGKAVDPAKFAFQNVAAQATPEPATPAAPPPPVIAFEDAMKRIPPTVDRATAKKGLLRSFFNAADRANDPSILAGLEASKRKDGTPSFSPDEVAAIQDARRQIADRVRVEADRIQRETWEDTLDGLQADWLRTNTPPSRSTLTALVDAGKLDPSAAFSIQNHVEAEARAEEREARAEARQARAEAEAAYDFDLSALREARLMGGLEGASYAEDVARLERGEFGIGRKAISRFNAARNAARAGAEVALKEPDAVMWGAQLQRDLMPVAGRQSRVSSALGAGNEAKDRAQALAAMAKYRQLVGEGKAPNIAYLEATAEYNKGPAGARAQEHLRNRRLAELRAKAGR